MVPYTRRFPWGIYIATAALISVLYNEYRLTVPSIAFTISTLTLFGSSRAILSKVLKTFNCKSIGFKQRNLLQSFITMTSLFGTAISGILSYSKEHMPFPRHLSSTQSLLLCASISLFTGSTFAGTSLIQFSPISFNEGYNIPWMPAACSNEIIVSIMSAVFAIIWSLLFSPTVFVSSAQIASFVVSIVALLVYAEAHNLGLPTALRSWWREWLVIEEEEEPLLEEIAREQKTNAITVVLLTSLIVTSTCLLSKVANTKLNNRTPSIPAHLDHMYISPSRFDIVVSMYQEDPIAVKHALSAIKSTSLLRNLQQQPRVILYTKSSTANTTILKSLLELDAVYKLDNFGREGGTYLHHILHNWDELAQQTMFLQAGAHNLRELIPRIDDFLVANTGMLSLGFAGVTCDCNSCTDRWGWDDNFGVVPSLYSKIYKGACGRSQQILLSYKGQFVASARRIRGIPKEIYQGLLKTINSKDGWSHNRDIRGDKVDSVDNPYFGHTVERIWSLLMQCSDSEVATMCPSLLSGWRDGGSIEDCQCLDPEAE
ncbi:hypothetical protein F5884DRAFT_687212 [Xylogone sp. PMI_703]|nr:hypothetical protein F5884DRAFT_687212 [Xylogone sp. PMI_703]